MPAEHTVTPLAQGRTTSPMPGPQPSRHVHDQPCPSWRPSLHQGPRTEDRRQQQLLGRMAWCPSEWGHSQLHCPPRKVRRRQEVKPCRSCDSKPSEPVPRPIIQNAHSNRKNDEDIQHGKGQPKTHLMALGLLPAQK